MKSTLSFEEYDILADRLSKNNHKCEDWWPTVEDIKEKIEPNFNKYIEFLIWILETAEKPETPEQIESKKYINKLLIKNIKLVDKTPDNIKAAIEERKKRIKEDNDNDIYEG